MADSSGVLSPQILQQLKNPTVRQLMATMMVREAGGEGPEGMKDAFQVAIDRANESGQSLQEVLMTPDAFTSMTFKGLGGNRNVRPLTPQDLQRAYGVMDDPNLKWDLPTTADAFINPQLQARFHAMDPKHYKETPEWLAGKDPVGSYGRHQFYATGYRGAGKPLDPSAAGVGGGIDPTQMPKLSPAEQAIVDANEAQRHALVGEQVANYDKQSALIDEEIKSLNASQSEWDGYNDRYQASMKKIVDGLPDEHKMEMDALREVSPDHPGDPHRALGQFLPMLVMLGGMFARGGGIGAMRASAAAVNAARSHDDQALARAHQEFQDNLSESVDKATMAHDMLANGLAKAQGDQKEVLQVADLIGTQLGIPALKIAALDGDTNAIYTHFATLTKAVGEGIGWQQKNLKLQMDQLKYQQLVNQADAGKALTDADLWTMATAFNNGIRPAPTFGLGANPLRDKFWSYVGLQPQHQDWAGPWGYGPDPTGQSDKPPVPGGQTTPPGGGAAPPPTSPTQAGVNIAEKHVLLKTDQQNLNNSSKVLTAIAPFARTMEDISGMAEKLAHSGLAGTPSPILNHGLQWLRTVPTSDPDVQSLRTLLATLGQEYGKLSSSSTGSVRELSVQYADRVHQFLNEDLPIKTFLSVVSTMLQETHARIHEQQDEVQQQQGALERHLKGDFSDGADQAPTAPAVGTVEDGYRFKGGDPSDKNNWEKVGG